MKFGFTGEIGKDVLIRFFQIARRLEKFINKELETSPFRDFETDINYCPIVMPKEFAENYPARSRMSHKDSCIIALQNWIAMVF